MKLIIKKKACLLNAWGGHPEKAPYVPFKRGTYEIERIPNPYRLTHPHYDGDWYVIKGTLIGMTIDAFKGRHDVFEIREN